MKIASLTFGLLTLCSVSLLADVLIVQKVEGAGHTGDVTIKVKGDKIRTDISPEVSTLLDAKTGNVQTIMHQQKMYMEITPEASEQLLKSLQQAGGEDAAEAAPAELKSTGKRETINGHDAEVYTLDSGKVKSTFWIAKDYPNGQLVLDLHKRMQDNPMAKMAQKMAPQPKDFPGVPVKTEVEVAPGQKIVTTLVSAEEKNFDDAEFSVPADYKAMAAPSFGAPAAAPNP